MCMQTVFPVAEVCDGLDNDCDGQIDDGNPGGGAACLTGIPGICMNGLTACSGGAILCTQTILPQVEVCDGLDNNCNGNVDEGLGSTTCGLGQCNHTVNNCVGGVLQVCNPFQGAQAEICDGIDNDCDGQTDEGLGTTTCGLGVCNHTVQNCLGGTPQVCNPLQGAVAEVCNDGLDNDCDGFIDCADPNCAASPFCVGPAENCTNFVDDNGNGLIDCADPVCNGQACGVGCLCAGGTRTETICNDGIDNDGDGLTDCADPNCAGNPACAGVENCTNGIDDDGDGWIDCIDAACQTNPACTIYTRSCAAIPTGFMCAVGPGHSCGAAGHCSEYSICVCP